MRAVESTPGRLTRIQLLCRINDPLYLVSFVILFIYLGDAHTGKISMIFAFKVVGSRTFWSGVQLVGSTCLDRNWNFSVYWLGYRGPITLLT